MRPTLTVLALVTMVAGMVTSSAWADDLTPPPWSRYQPGTTFEEWEFSTSDPVTSPEPGYFNPYGEPSAHAYPGTGQNWVDEWGGRQGIWPLSGTIEATIPNDPEPNPYKDIWVQLTWAKQVESSTPVVWDMTSGVYGTLVEQEELGPTGEAAPNDYWYHSVYEIHIVPNPSSEIVKIDGTLLVNELVVNTICVPEPSTLVLLVVGAVGLLVCSRRHRRA